MKAFTVSLLAAVLLVPFQADVFGQEGDVSSAAKTEFEWFSGLGFADVKGCPLVRVATGGWGRSGNEPPEKEYRLGFLLSTNDKSFSVLDMYLAQSSYTNSASGTAEYERVGFERKNLKQQAGEILGFLEVPHDRDQEANRQRSGNLVTDRVQLFVLGWACWRNGLDDEAQRLYVAAQKSQRAAYQDKPGETFHISLEKNLGNSMMWRGVLDFDNPSVGWAELLKEFRAIETNYPASEFQARAKETADRLAKMVAEQEAHDKLPRRDPGSLSVEEHVSELIFLLRNQNGQQFSQPGHCDIFMVRSGDTNTPAHQLVKIGFPAVPQLIAALDNPTFTRSVGFHRGFYFSHTVLTVGDCAAAILQRISGKTLYTPQSTSSYLSKDGDVGQVRQRVEAWWKEVQEKGEKQTLIDATIAGDAVQQARLLWERYPEDAMAAVVKGAQASTQSGPRMQMIWLLAETERPEATNFLVQELREGPFLECRAIAATELEKRHNAEAVPVMLREWTNSGATSFAGKSGLGNVMQFLARANSPEAINSLAINFGGRPVEDRRQIVQNVGDLDYAPARLVNTSNALEKLLVAALPDTEEAGGYGVIYGKNLNNPRICDLAGFYLNHAWSNRYDFDLDASLKVRNRQRVECQNVWRKANNLPELPLPADRNTHVSAEEAAKVTAVVWAEGSLKPNADDESFINGLVGKILTASNVVAIFTRYAEKPLPGSRGLEVRVRKDEDLTGVEVSVNFLPGGPQKFGQSWSTTQSGTLGHKGILGLGGDLMLEFSKDASRWEYLMRAASQALASPPETPFFIYAKVTVKEPK